MIETIEGRALTIASRPEAMRTQLDDIKATLALVQEFFRDAMVEGVDYGVIPGTPKPSLLKPGAEKLCELYGYGISLAEKQITSDRETGFCEAVITVALRRRTGELVAEGVGECNTMEGRYRWRTTERLCPDCGKPAIIKGREEYGGGWICYEKKGGCRAKFADNDERLTGQTVERVENEDPWGMWNTILKMAKKRALVDAALSATRSSGLFTQDVEDLAEWVTSGSGRPLAPQAAPAQRRKPDAAKWRQPKGPKPECPEHGAEKVKYVPGGVSKKTGNSYDAFWACDVKGCTSGSRGGSYYIDADAWAAQNAPTDGSSEDPDDLPLE